MKLRMAVSAALILSSVACGFRVEKAALSPNSLLSPSAAGGAQSAAPSYAQVRDTVFSPRCVRCHDSDARVPLDTYEHARHFLPEIRETVFAKKAMPKKGALTQNESDLLRAWLDAGAPETVVAVIPSEASPEAPGHHDRARPGPAEPDKKPCDLESRVPVCKEEPKAEPEPKTEPKPVAKPRWAEVKKRVFEKSCKECHDADFDSLEDVRRDFKAIRRQVVVKRTMPDLGSPQAEAMTDEERTLLDRWIQGGMEE
jgi:uncharacterized membrane protein